MIRFPDQSQLNILLREFTEKNIQQFKEVHHQLFQENSQSMNTHDTIVVDVDQSGLIANGKSSNVQQKAISPGKGENKAIKCLQHSVVIPGKL